MKDYLAQIEKLRKDAAERALIRDLASDPAKREVFDSSVVVDMLSGAAEMPMHGQSRSAWERFERR
ncbi:hypothetical protein GPL17_26060 [Bradyrhizobium yuanmingense]|uniref:hypothetical protein n=1 Tax=Bradyrhizobium yuanmingense TaxID=108015 RepID=UPI0012FCC706|nr:hypothetical protein [Bradyrhizobium yuanmingense]MDF0581458.1 hypothetical protein [Bradyrhizobium yuanmingense]MVT53942.1 hypothetical protein [Bradyrhizobium yuanmingense]